MDDEEQEDKEKRAQTETRHNGNGSLFIHFLGLPYPGFVYA
jgi:hypothetical protein